MEEDNALLDANVHGWIYTPFQGQMNRKQRIFVSLARQLVGLPATPVTVAQRKDSNNHNVRTRSSSPKSARPVPFDEREELSVLEKANAIIQKGEFERQVANRGSYSEPTNLVDKRNSTSPVQEYDNEGNRYSKESDDTLSKCDSNAPTKIDRSSPSLQGRALWSQSNILSTEDMSIANNLLMSRLQLFMATPSANVPVSVFFYNEERSRQKITYTDNAGHFTLRAPLGFVPTHVRVLAGEALFATERVNVIEPKGISLISDIDDTIKHSAIGSGAREIFRNAFIRDLGELTIDGVKHLYNSLADLGVHVHYVSNSPWQMYPVLRQFFSLADLPPGSFHLKQYSGMLQGIFEPVAERKKGTLDRLVSDFSERQFILIGDSGEADLEVYTEFALENPGKILGIFIRDVTTNWTQAFFDSAMAPLTAEKLHSQDDTKIIQPTPRKPKNVPMRTLSNFVAPSTEEEEEEADMKKAIGASLEEHHPNTPKPQPPPKVMSISGSASPWEKKADRSNTEHKQDYRSSKTPSVSDEDKKFNLSKSASVRAKHGSLNETSMEDKKPASSLSSKGQEVPPLPRKPLSLRSNPSEISHFHETTRSKPKNPPKPPQPRRQSSSSSVAPVNVISSSHQSSNMSPECLNQLLLDQRQPPKPPKPRSSRSTQMAQKGKTAAAAAAATTAAHRSAVRQRDGTSLKAVKNAASLSTRRDVDDDDTVSDNASAPPPPLPARRGISSYSVSAAQMMASKVYGAWVGNGTSGSSAESDTYHTETYDTLSNIQQVQEAPPPKPTRPLSSPTSSSRPDSPPPNKKEELWRRRWAQAQELLKEQGVVLRSWRVGTDVVDEAVALVRKSHEHGEKSTGKSR